MPLPAVVESLDAVPESVREFYRPDADGKRYLLDAEDVVPGGENLGALKRALEREKAEHRKYARLAEERGSVDPEEYKSLRAEKEAREREDAEKKGHYEKVIGQVKEAAAKERAEAEAKASAYWQRLEEKFVAGDATALIHKAGPMENAAEILMPHVRQHTRLIEEGGDLRVVVVDAKGEIRHSSKTGEEMSLEELILEMKNGKFASLFRASGASGGGATAAASGARGQDLSKLSPLQKVERAYNSGAN